MSGSIFLPGDMVWLQQGVIALTLKDRMYVCDDRSYVSLLARSGVFGWFATRNIETILLRLSPWGPRRPRLTDGTFW